MKLSMIIPCYNEEEVIQETNKRLGALINVLYSKAIIKEHEIIYIDDGSQDNTLTILRRLASIDKNIKVIAFSNNFGHQSALTAGLHHASGDVSISLDADLQDPPEVVEEMLIKYQRGYDIVYGVRKSRNNDSFFKKITAQIFYKLLKTMGVNLIEDHADFRLVSRPVLNAFTSYTEVNRFLRGLFPLIGFKQCIVEYERKKRFSGQTKYPLKKMISLAIEGITSFSYVPLRIVAVLGFMTAVITIFLILWVFIIKFLGKAIPGWASTVLPIYLFGGIQLMFLGILGEYIGKIYMETKKRPIYLIKEKLNF